MYYSAVTDVSLDGEELYYDLHVPGYENYLANGMWHHNTGKTWAAVALMRRRIEQGEGALFFQMSDLLEQIKATYGRAKDGSDGPTTEEVLAGPREVSLLVLDDIGAEYDTPHAIDQILQLLEARRGKVTLFTSNLNVDQLQTKIGERIASRIVGLVGGRAGNILYWGGADRRYGLAS